MSVAVDHRVLRLLEDKRLKLVRGQGYSLLYHADLALLLELSEDAARLFAMIDGGDSPETSLLALSESRGGQAASALLHSISGLADYLEKFGAARFDKEAIISALTASSPTGMMLFATNTCNFNCTYCYEKYSTTTIDHKVRLHLTSDRMRRAVDDMLARSSDAPSVKITFFGGEPLLNFEIVKEAVAYARSRGGELGKSVEFAISTNGYLLREEVAEFLVANGFGVLVSIDGDRSAHDLHRRLYSGEGTYETVSRNVGRLLSLQLSSGVSPLLIRATLTMGNEDAALVREALLRDFPGARVMIGSSDGTLTMGSMADVPLPTLGYLEEQMGVLETSMLADSIEVLSSRHAQSIDSLRRIHSILESSGPTANPYKMCGVNRGMVGVSADGNYYPCHRFVGIEGFRIGNITDGLRKADVQGQFQAYFDAIEPVCSVCWAKRLCGGPCPASVAIPGTGKYGAPKVSDCDLRRAGFERMLGLYWLIQTHRPEVFSKLISLSSTDERPTIETAMRRDSSSSLATHNCASAKP